MKPRQLIIACLLLIVAESAFSQTIDVNGVLDIVKQSIAPAMGKLTTQAITWLGALSALQFFITSYNQLKSDGDIQSVVVKAVGSVAWVGVCLYLINNAPSFIQAAGDQMMSLLGMDLPTPSSVVTKTVFVAASMGAGAVGISAIPLIGDTAGMFLVYITLAVLAIGLLFSFKIFMLQLEIMLVAMLAPISFALLGLNSLKDQGIAPFKALISFAYRVILLTVILSGFNEVSDVTGKVITGIGKEAFALDGVQKVVQTVLSALGAYLLLAYLAFKSDSIAASLASGSTSMGTGDVAAAAATGAALGAAIASGGATAAATGGKAPQAMADFMGKMAGGGGSVSNASPMGSGGEIPSFTPPALMAVGAPAPAGGRSTGASSSSGPRRPAAAAPGARQASVASSRFGPALQGEGPAPHGAASTPASGEQSAAAADGANDAQATGTDPTASMPSTTSRGQAADAAPAAPESGSPAAAPGSSLSAGISGRPSLEVSMKKLGDAVDQLAKSQQQAPRKPTLGERLGEANRHVSQEQATTHVSINTHHGD